MEEHNVAFAEFMIRLITGILFFFQGFDKLFNIKMDEVIATFMRDAERRHIPRPMVAFISYLTSLIELIAGFLLIIGLFTNYALLALSVDLVIISLAFSIMQPMWDLKHVFPRIILITILFIISSNYNKISLDNLFNL